MGDISRELDFIHQTIKDGFSGLNARLDELNGRTRTAETKIAVLEDRSEKASDTTARWTAGLTAIVVVIGEIARQVWAR